MKFLRIVFVLAVALGIAWAADESPEPAAQSGGDQPGVEQLSQAELDAEMERMEAALGESDEVVEFIPTKPLAADLPVALPSDI
jgi:hypothetical protein